MTFLSFRIWMRAAGKPAVPRRLRSGCLSPWSDKSNGSDEKTPVTDGHRKMDVLPEVYLWYNPRLWTQIYCPLKSYTETYLLKWCVYPVEKSL